MTSLNSILDSNWDGTICTKPSFMTLRHGNYRGYQRVVGTQKIVKSDDMIGLLTRDHYDPDAYDAYDVIITTMTSEADLENMITAVKKVCATYTPTSAENILKWEGGNYDPFNNVRWIFTFSILVYRAGIVGYT